MRVDLQQGVRLAPVHHPVGGADLRGAHQAVAGAGLVADGQEHLAPHRVRPRGGRGDRVPQRQRHPAVHEGARGVERRQPAHGAAGERDPHA